jgi:3-isopropylmalate/(R)-2-methylmalate dehydratase small subunit
MAQKFTGNAWIFGDHVDTDMIIPSRFLVTSDEAELGRSVFAETAPAFAGSVAKGDILVAGRNFGCGSSREHAPLAIRGAGISCIVAESFARTFFRNCIDRGLYAIEAADVRRHVRQGDRLAVDIGGGTVSNLTTGDAFQFAPYPDFISGICDQGGLFQYIQNRLDAMI